jgi:hypothetical protein
MDLLKELIKEKPLQEAVAEGPAFTVQAIRWRKFIKATDVKLEALDLQFSSSTFSDVEKTIEAVGGDVKLAAATKKAFDKFYELFRDLEMDVGNAIEAGGDDE